MRDCGGTGLITRWALTSRNSRPRNSPWPARQVGVSSSKRACWGPLQSSASRQRSCARASSDAPAIVGSYANVCSLSNDFRAGGVTDDAWANAAKHDDEDQLAALVSLIALINAFNRMNVVVQMPAGDYQPGQFG